MEMRDIIKLIESGEPRSLHDEDFQQASHKLKTLLAEIKTIAAFFDREGFDVSIKDERDRSLLVSPEYTLLLRISRRS